MYGTYIRSLVWIRKHLSDLSHYIIEITMVCSPIRLAQVSNLHKSSILRGAITEKVCNNTWEKKRCARIEKRRRLKLGRKNWVAKEDGRNHT